MKVTVWNDDRGCWEVVERSAHPDPVVVGTAHLDDDKEEGR